MPSRMACVAILSFWVYAAFALIQRDILPAWIVAPPPDLRAIARAEPRESRTRWDLQIASDDSLKNLHLVGFATTESRREPDASTILTSVVSFDSERLFRGTMYQALSAGRVTLSNRCEIDPTGNLANFHADCRSADRNETFVNLDGSVHHRELVVRISSPLHDPILGSYLNRTQTFPYAPRGIVQNAVGPLDRMPGLQVGQQWRSQVVSPLTGSVVEVNVAVTGRYAIQWGNGVVSTLEVVHTMPPILKARTWVRPDGLVLRQEVPFPFVKLILERVPTAEDLGQRENSSP